VSTATFFCGGRELASRGLHVGGADVAVLNTVTEETDLMSRASVGTIIQSRPATLRRPEQETKS
jgi:hypothetical protein